VSCILEGHHSCVDCLRVTVDDIRILAEAKGGYIKDIKYLNYHSKVEIFCGLGHSWDISYSNLRNGHWCPFCAKFGKNEKLLFDIVQEIFTTNDGFSIQRRFNGFEWLKNKKTGKRQHIDVFVKGKRYSIGFEYDGKQHFGPVKFFGAHTESEAIAAFKIQKARDNRKNRLIKKHPEDITYFIRFSYKDKLTPQLVKEKIKEKIGDLW